MSYDGFGPNQGIHVEKDDALSYAMDACGIEPQKGENIMDKLILTVHRSSTITSNLVRLPDDAIEIVRQIQLESGLSASSIVAQILRWAQNRVEIKEI